MRQAFRDRKWMLVALISMLLASGAVTGLLYSDSASVLDEFSHNGEVAALSDFESSDNSPIWQQFGNDTRHAARSGLRGSQSSRLRWNYDVSGWPAEPSVAISEDEHVYLTTSLYGYEGYLYCLDMDGQDIWSYFINSDLRYPAISEDSDLIYVVSGDFLNAIDPDRTYQWGHYIGTNGSFTGPTVSDAGRIYLGYQGKLQAFTSSGLAWSYDVPGTSYIDDTPVVDSDGTAYFSATDRKVYAVQSGGTLQWTYNVAWPVSSVLSMYDDDNIYFGTDNYKGTGENDYAERLFALSAGGALLWTFDANDGIEASPAIAADGSIVIATKGGKVYCLRSDGSLRWLYDQPDTPILSSPAIDVDGSIYFGCDNDMFYALNSFGMLLWTYDVGYSIKSSPAIGPHETVIFSSDGEIVHCLESLPRLSDGKVTPNVGDDGDSYTFSVHYYSPAQRAPFMIVVDSSIGTYSMTHDPDSGDDYDGIYIKTIRKPRQGYHNFKFQTRDKAKAQTVYLPPSGTFPGPVVDNNGDSYENDDTCAQAQAGHRYISTNGQPQYRTLLPGDHDWVMFEAQENVSYLVRTALASTDCDTVLHIYDPTCSEELAFDDDSGFGPASRIEWTCPEDETYFIWIHHHDESSGAGEYYINVEPASWVSFKCGGSRQSRSAALGCPGDSVAWSVEGVGSSHAPVVGLDGCIHSANSAGWLYSLQPGGSVSWSYNANMAPYSGAALSRSGDVFVKSQYGYVIALDSDGTLRWTFGVGDDIGGSPIVGIDDTVYCCSENGYLYAIDSGGSGKWSFDSTRSIESSPALGVDGRVYIVNSFGFLFSLASDGGYLWYNDLEESASTTPLINSAGEVVVLGDGGTLFCYGPDGSWRWTYNCSGGDVTASPALGLDDTILVSKGGGIVTAVASDGSLLWTYSGGFDLHSTPAVDRDGYIYIGDSGLKSLTPDGSVRWTYDTGSAANSSPAIGPDGTVYIESNYPSGPSQRTIFISKTALLRPRRAAPMRRLLSRLTTTRALHRC